MQQVEMMRFILDEGKKAVARRYTIALKKVEKELERMNSTSPRVELVVDQLREIIARYKGMLAAIASVNPEEYVIYGTSLYEVLNGESKVSAESSKYRQCPGCKQMVRRAGFKQHFESGHLAQIKMSDGSKLPSGYKKCLGCGQVVHGQVFQKHVESGHMTGIRKKSV